MAHVIDLCEYARTTIHYAVDRLVGHNNFTESDRDDLEQDLALDLIERLPDFDPARAKRSTFIMRCVEHRIANLIRDRHRARRDPRRACRIGDDGVEDKRTVSISSVTDGHAASERERTDLRIDLAATVAALPTHLQSICSLLPDHSPYAISRRLGMSKRAIYRDVNTIRAAFTSAGLETYLA